MDKGSKREKLWIDAAEASSTSVQQREHCQLLLIVGPTYRTDRYVKVFPRYTTPLFHTSFPGSV